MKSIRDFRLLFCAVTGVCLAGLCPASPSSAYGQFGGAGQAKQSQANQAQAEPDAPRPKIAPGEKPPSTLIEIPNEPKEIDPATLVPKELSTRVTVEFKKRPLKDVFKWLEQEQSLNVIVDTLALSEEGILLGEPITDHSTDAPLYLLLDRVLQTQLLDWYFEDETLLITTATAANEHMSTIPYPVGDLFDEGYKSQSLLRAIQSTTPGSWEDTDGEGGKIVLLGDVAFIRQTQAVHQQVAGTLTALRKHARRTFVSDPPIHEVLRQKLNQNVTVDFVETPLNDAIAQLSQQVGADIRLETRILLEEGISERAEVSLKMKNRPLHNVLRAMLINKLLTWSLQDGVLWITSEANANGRMETAVFDVRDLCQNNAESNGLMRALHSQTRGKWEEVDGEGGRMICPRPGVLVIRNTPPILDDVLKLLESYRAALLVSKPREVAEIDPKEVISKYYRMQKEVASDLEKLLPELVQPDTWNSAARPGATGTIRNVTSTSGVIGGNVNDGNAAANSGKANTLVVANSVLIISQSREVHDAIEKVIQKIQFGEPGGALKPPMTGGMGGMGGGMSGGGMGGMGGGGGGFGGGFFSVPKK